MRGFFQGSLWALVLGGTGLSFASLVGEQPVFGQGPAAPQLVTPELTPQSPTPQVSVEIVEEAAPALAVQAPRVAEPAVEETAPTVETEPAALPATADVAAAIDAPSDAADLNVSSDVDGPVEAPAVSVAPQAPVEETVVAIDSTPATPQPAPEADTVAAEQLPTETVQSVEVVEEVVEEETPNAPLVTIVEAAPDPADPLVVTELTVPVEDDVAAAPAPEVDVAEADVAEPDVAEQASDVVVAEAASEQEDPAPAPEVIAPVVTETEPVEDVVAPQADVVTVTPEVVTPAPEIVVAQDETPQSDALPQVNTQVRINRPVTTEDVVEEEVAAADDPDALPDDAPALLRYAAPFQNPQDLPMMSVILLEGGASSDASALADLGFSPTIAVDALSAGASDKVADYRAAGLEVAMQIALPQGAQPTDVEVAFEAAFGIVPEAAMLFADGTGIIQNDRTVTSQVMEILASDGRGFVAVQRGLGNSARAAEQEGVPAATVARDLDGSGENPSAILRALDQAAFRARQSGGAVLLARMTPATLQVLGEWAAENDQDTLVLAPVSAVLLAQDE